MKVMIVDDEVIIRTGLATVIEWEEHGFTLLPSAESAEEALELIARDQPNIVLSDIRMGGMNGLQMADILRERYPEMELIILSGFDDFQYAQHALRSGIGDYLLKSSRPEEIVKAALKAKQRIEKRQASARQESRMSSLYRDQVMEALLSGGELPEEPELTALLPALRPRPPEQDARYRAAVLVPSGWGDSAFYGDLLLFAAANMLAEQLPCETLLLKERVVAIIRQDGREGCAGPLRTAVQAMERMLTCKLFTSIGSAVSEIAEIRRSFREAEETYEYRGFAGVLGPLVAYEDIAGRRGVPIVPTLEEEAELAALLKNGESTELRYFVHRVVKRTLSDAQATPATTAAYFQALLLAGCRWLERALQSVGLDTAAVRREPVFWEASAAAEEALFRELLNVMNVYKDSATTDRLSYVTRAIAYIGDHLNCELSLQQVSRHVHLHPNHFSEMFRKETGLTYIEFVKKERIARAARILTETEAKIGEVAEQVGYADLKYFTKLFKQYTGKTPSDYRSKT